MRKLSARAFILFFLVWAASIMINRFIYQPLQLVPYSYSAKSIHLKRTYLNLHKDEFNTAFIGSSHVLRQFDAPLFDSLVSRNGNSVHSFNYGISALAASELFYISDHLLDDYLGDSLSENKIPLKYLFLELSQITFPRYSNLHTTRMFYWYEWDYYAFTWKAIFNSQNTALPLKLAMAAFHTIGFFDKQLNFGHVNDINNFYMQNEDVSRKLDSLSNNYNGFDPREKARKKFLKNPVEITLRRTQTSAEQFQKYENNPQLLNKYNKQFLARINETIDEFSRHGIHTIFVFTPLAEKEEYDEIIPLLNQIDAKHKIEIADSRKYPELYALAHLVDATHLNKKGAEIFTSILAQKFNELISNNQVPVKK